jgi:hypothetical protein
MTRRYNLYAALWICFLAEAGSLSFLRPWLGMYASPLVYTVAALCTIILMVLIKKKYTAVSIKKRSMFRHMDAGILAAFVAVMFQGWYLLKHLFARFPIAPAQSDIIPLIGVMSKRFLAGERVYEPVTDFGYAMFPNYLPLTWLPFTIADLLQVDYRAWSYLIFCCSLALFILFAAMGKRHSYTALILPSLVFILFHEQHPSAFGWTVEPIIAGFYILLVAALYIRSTPLLIAALILCLLSRYAVLPWLPCLLLALFFMDQKRKAVMIAFSVVAGIAFILGPFLFQDPQLLKKGFQYYTTGALAEWSGQSWQAAGALPYQLSQGLGAAIFFYKAEGSLEQRLGFLQQTHGIVSVLAPFVFFGFYRWRWKAWLPLNWALMLSLKLYLVIFFVFIQVPYAYLYFTPLMISACIMALLVMDAYNDPSG